MLCSECNLYLRVLISLLYCLLISTESKDEKRHQQQAKKVSSNQHLSTGDSINDALLQVGDIRKYQICMLLGTVACCMLASMQTLALVFTQAAMDYRSAINYTRLLYDTRLLLVVAVQSAFTDFTDC